MTCLNGDWDACGEGGRQYQVLMALTSAMDFTYFY